ncbi:hypothetical protein L3V83_01355 [Thiotrichales bacterium 19X7-9]|nr:hypothetical protein [Thiotrichales bacterium 19X7-9]
MASKNKQNLNDEMTDFPLDLDQLLSHTDAMENQEIAQALGSLVSSAIELTKLASEYETITSADDFLKLYQKCFLSISGAFEHAG